MHLDKNVHGQFVNFLDGTARTAMGPPMGPPMGYKPPTQVAKF